MRRVKCPMYAHCSYDDVWCLTVIHCHYTTPHRPTQHTVCEKKYNTLIKMLKSTHFAPFCGCNTCKFFVLNVVILLF
jgi:hypothetical protein